MKTTGFAKISIESVENGIVVLSASAPGEGLFDIEMSADECFLLLVEMGNVLSEARAKEKGRRQEDELERELRR